MDMLEKVSADGKTCVVFGRGGLSPIESAADIPPLVVRFGIVEAAGLERNRHAPALLDAQLLD